LLTLWYETGGARGLPLEGQELIDLAFDLHVLPEQLLTSDPTWLHKLLAARYARVMARRK
jgi:hypothetical protein